MPVYINLSSFTAEKDSIFSRVCQRLERKPEFVNQLLAHSKIYLLLDGFNEILPHLNDYLIRHLQSFIDEYPHIRICIASRPVAYEKITFKRHGAADAAARPPIPAFILQQMENEMDSFIDKNYKEADIKELKAYLNEQKNAALKAVLKTPLYLAEFLLIYRTDKTALVSSTQITKKFIFLKYKREFDKNKNFDEKSFHRLLSAYAQAISYDDKFGFYNPTVSENQLFQILKQEMVNYPFAAGVDAFIGFAIGMNLLVHDKQNSTFSFAHQSYQDFYNEEDI